MPVPAIKREDVSRVGWGHGNGLPDSASLTADDDGNLTLRPVGDHPINITKGGDHRYHVDVGNQDIAFTPEQMGRLDIQAGSGNRLRIDKNVDIPVKVNGQPCGPDGPMEMEEARGRGYESIPELAGDKYTGPETRTPAATAALTAEPTGTPSTRTPQEARNTDANRVVTGHNWDNVGVPQKTDKATPTGSPQTKRSGEETPNPAEKEEAKKPEKGKGKPVILMQLTTTGPEEVKVENDPDAIRIKIFKNEMDLWKKMMQNMQMGARNSIVLADANLNHVKADVAGLQANELAKRLEEMEAQRLQDARVNPPPAEVNASTNLDNRKRG